jgi:hypothetical protein
MSKINFTQRVSINEVRDLIKTIGEDVTVIVKSEPGVGKSSLLGMLEKDLGDKYDYIYVDCPSKDIPDVGMTVPDRDTKALEYYVASLFKLDSPKPKLIMLDEFAKVPKLLQVIFTRLMLEKYVGDRKLPDGSMIFGTSNNAGDGVGDNMLAHAGNRVCIVEMRKHTAEEWCLWASENGISRIMRSWVTQYSRCMKSYRDGDQEDNPYIFHPSKPVLSFFSPRSAAKADAILRKRDYLTENTVTTALAGTIGLAAAKDMEVYLAMDKKLPSVRDEILKDPQGIKVPEEIAAQLMIMFEAIDVLDTQDELSKFMLFVNRIASSEIQSIFFTMLMRTPRTIRLARNNTQVTSWATQNHVLFG